MFLNKMSSRLSISMAIGSFASMLPLVMAHAQTTTQALTWTR